MDNAARVSWAEIKAQLDAGMPFREIPLTGSIKLVGTEGNISFFTIIHTDGDMAAEYADYQANYQANKNAAITAKDSEGAPIMRMKAAKKGWTYAAIPIEFETSQIDSLYAKTVDGSDRPGISLNFYDGNGVEITEEGLLEINETNIVDTVITFEPPYDYEIIGGVMRLDQNIEDPNFCRLWIIAVPDIPAGSGGSKEMAGGINLKFLAPENPFEVDGRVSKMMVYDAQYHTNKLQILFRHNPGLKKKIQIVIELYRA